MQSKIKVSLISHTPEPLKQLYTCVRMCQTSLNISQLCVSAEVTSTAKTEAFLNSVIESGHDSILESVSFTFGVEGISRVCSHQLVRHRIASYQQRSQRFVEEGGGEIHIPEEILNSPNKKVLKLYKDTAKSCFEAAQKLREMGVSCDSSRMMYPNCTTTQLIMTVNLRSLINMCNERLCKNASPEITQLFEQVAKLVSNEMPVMESYLVPKCKKLGFCKEKFSSCAKRGSEIAE